MITDTLFFSITGDGLKNGQSLISQGGFYNFVVVDVGAQIVWGGPQGTGTVLWEWGVHVGSYPAKQVFWTMASGHWQLRIEGLPSNPPREAALLADLTGGTPHAPPGKLVMASSGQLIAYASDGSIQWLQAVNPPHPTVPTVPLPTSPSPTIYISLSQNQNSDSFAQYNLTGSGFAANESLTIEDKYRPIQSPSDTILYTQTQADSSGHLDFPNYGVAKSLFGNVSHSISVVGGSTGKRSNAVGATA